jgi:hypothetical protein
MDRVYQTTTSTGTGDVTLAHVGLGCRKFSEAVDVGTSFHYEIKSTDGSEWEVGIGHLSDATTLVRDAVIASTNSGALVSFSGALKRVFYVEASPTHNAEEWYTFGDGSDGDVTISSGTTNLSRDMFYRNLTISSTGLLNPKSFRVFVSGVLDISNCTNGLRFPTSPSHNAPQTLGSGGISATSVNGQTGNGLNGNATSTALTPYRNGGTGGAGGNGGNGSVGTGGTGGAATPNYISNGSHPNATETAYPIRRLTTELGFPIFTRAHSGSSVSTMQGGGGSGTGGSGGGDGTNAGGGNGSSNNGLSGITIGVWARVIKRDATTTATGAISSNGMNCTANSANGSAGNTGGGGGSGGHGGGWVYVVYEALAGTAKTGCITANGGNGGSGGNGTGTGTGGDSGFGGNGGRITVIDLGKGTLTETVGASGTQNLRSGATGGSGTGTGGACSVTL